MITFLCSVGACSYGAAIGVRDGCWCRTWCDAGVAHAAASKVLEHSLLAGSEPDIVVIIAVGDWVYLVLPSYACPLHCIIFTATITYEVIVETICKTGNDACSLFFKVSSVSTMLDVRKGYFIGS